MKSTKQDDLIETIEKITDLEATSAINKIMRIKQRIEEYKGVQNGKNSLHE